MPEELESVQSDAIPREKRYSLASIAIACALLVLPLVYLFLRQPAAGTAQVPAAPVGSTPAANSVAALEELARSRPTPENRINLSMAYINEGAPGRALPVLLALVAEDKNNALAWNNLCVAQTLQKDYTSAVEDCNRALAIEPNFQLAKNNLKWASEERDKALHAITAGNQAAGTHNSAFYLGKGLDELHVGEYDRAIADWQQTLRLDPKSALAANNIGTAYMMKKQPDEAIVWFDKAIAMDPSLQLAKNNLAWANAEKAKVGK